MCDPGRIAENCMAGLVETPETAVERGVPECCQSATGGNEVIRVAGMQSGRRDPELSGRR